MNTATVDFVWRWLQKVPEFSAELGVRGPGDLRYLGEGGRAQVVYLGEIDGSRRVLKVVKSSSQAALSRLAMEERPEGIIRVYDVVETEGERSLLPELPRKGEEPFYETRSWGVVEQLAIPIENLDDLADLTIAGVHAYDLSDVFDAILEELEADHVDPSLVRRWRMSYDQALGWVEDACRRVGSPPDWDLHRGNWGVDPDTGDLLLIDLGQCHVV